MISEVPDNWQTTVGSDNTNLYNRGVALINANNTYLLPGAKGTFILATTDTIATASRVYVYPSGGFDRVEARKQ